MKLSLQFLLAALCWLAAGTRSVSAPSAAAPPRGYSIPLLDLAGETNRQVIVDREPGQYLGHPTTVLLEDGKTILCVYPKGHGKGPIIFKRSPDGGLTWSSRLPVPATWATSKETPTIHRVVDAAGKKRLIVWSGLYPARLAVSEDDGQSWSDLRTAGDWGRWVADFERRLVAPCFHGNGIHRRESHVSRWLPDAGCLARRPRQAGRCDRAVHVRHAPDRLGEDSWNDRR